MPSDHPALFERFVRESGEHAACKEAATVHWRDRCEQIAAEARAGNRFDFLRWPSLTDFSVPEAWISPAYYEDLRKQPDWQSRWRLLTRETNVGTPKIYSPDFGTSPILVQHAYHLLCYERATTKSLLDCDVVFEVGGGYGSFCRLLKNAGFDGLHLIYDLPHVSSIQRLFLSLSGFKEISLDKIGRVDEHSFGLVTAEGLDEVHSSLSRQELKVAFVATWSLSEMPLDVRKRLFPRFHRVCDRYLFAYQPAWERIDNASYFAKVARDRPDLRWFSPSMPQISYPPHSYLFA